MAWKGVVFSCLVIAVKLFSLRCVFWNMDHLDSILIQEEELNKTLMQSLLYSYI